MARAAGHEGYAFKNRPCSRTRDEWYCIKGFAHAESSNTSRKTAVNELSGGKFRTGSFMRTCAITRKAVHVIGNQNLIECYASVNAAGRNRSRRLHVGMLVRTAAHYEQFPLPYRLKDIHPRPSGAEGLNEPQMSVSPMLPCQPRPCGGTTRKACGAGMTNS